MPASRRQFLTSAVALTTGAPLAFSAEQPPQPGKTPHTRFAVNVEMWWRKLPFLQRLEEAARLGFPAVEFWPWQSKDLPAIVDTCRKLKLEIAQFTAWGFRPGLNDSANHGKFLEAVEAGCKVAHQLNCRMMCVVGGDDIKGMAQAQMHDNIIAGLRQAAPLAEKHKITLILEPMNIRVDHKGHCLYGSEATMRILKAVGSPHVKMLADLYHLHITEGDICGHLKENYEQIGYVQIADHPGRNVPGTGVILYPRVLRQLHDLGYRGYVGLECRPLKTELEAALAVNRADQW